MKAHFAVQPAVVRWAISSAGWDEEELAKKLDVAPTKLSGWMNGDIVPTIGELEKLAKETKRPMAAFLLDSPPIEDPMPKDFRMLPDRQGKFERKTIFAIREARYLQASASDMLEAMREQQPPSLSRYRLMDRPEDVAHKEREARLSSILDVGHPDPYERFRMLREWIENKGIFVFQMSMPVDDVRGFSLADKTPFVIVVNSSDSIVARSFTLLHEYGHLLLRETTISMPESTLMEGRQNESEIWCNRLASELILPEGKAKARFISLKAVDLDKESLTKLSREFGVSLSMLLLRMKRSGAIDNPHYESLVSEMSGEFNNNETGGGGEAVDRRVLRERGHRYVSLVSSTLASGRITTSSALELLEIKLKDLDKVVMRV